MINAASVLMMAMFKNNGENIFASERNEENVYTVKAGDTMWIIARAHGVSLDSLIAANPDIQNPDLIYPGDRISIPKNTGNGGSPIPGGENNSGNGGNPVTNDMEEQVVALVNAERKARGLNPLMISNQVGEVAGVKAKDMYDNQYFSHNSPVYGSPFDMLKTFGVPYTMAAENIAKGQTTPQGVVNAWMNSSGHRANILNENYSQTGVGYYAGTGGPYWVQMFIK